jgi:hypothetical protein
MPAAFSQALTAPELLRLLQGEAEVAERACRALQVAGLALDGRRVFACADRFVVSVGSPEGDARVAESFALALPVAGGPTDTCWSLMCRDGFVWLPQVLHSEAEVVQGVRLRLARCPGSGPPASRLAQLKGGHLVSVVG